MTTALWTPRTVVDDEYLISAATNLRNAYIPWVQDMQELRDIESTRPQGYSGTALMSGIQATMLQQAQAPYTEFVSGRLQVMHQNYVGRMINSPCEIEAMQISDDRTEEARREALLNVANGILYNLDRSVQLMGMGTSWRRLVAESSAFPGKIIGFPFVQQGRDGQAKVSCTLWDPLTVFHDLGTWPRRVVHEWRTGVLDARKWLESQTVDGQPGFEMPTELRIERPDQTVIVSDIWVEEPALDGPDEYNVWHGILINYQPAGRQLTGFGHTPIVMVSTHANISSYQAMGMLAGGSTASPPDFRGVPYEAIVNHCQPFYSALKHPQRQWKAMVSTIFEGIASAMNPSLQIASEKANVDVSEAMLAPGGRFRTDLTTKLEAVDRGVQQIGEAVRICVDMMDGEFNRLYDETLLGQDHAGSSGFNNVQKTSHAKTVLNEPAAGCSAFVLGTFTELIHQLQRNPNLRFRARAAGRPGSVRGSPSPMQDYSAADLPEDITLTVDWVPDLGDQMQQISAAQQYIALGLPASEVWSKSLNIKNAQQLQERADMEAVRADPRVHAANVTQYFLERWLEAQDAAGHAKNPARKRALEVAAGFYKRQYEADEAAMNPAAQNPGTPAGAPGIPPGVLPPEAGPNNPDMMAAAKGLQSSAAGGQGAMDVLGQGGGKKPGTIIRNGKPIVTSIGGLPQ